MAVTTGTVHSSLLRQRDPVTSPCSSGGRELCLPASTPECLRGRQHRMAPGLGCVCSLTKLHALWHRRATHRPDEEEVTRGQAVSHGSCQSRAPGRVCASVSDHTSHVLPHHAASSGLRQVQASHPSGSLAEESSLSSDF